MFALWSCHRKNGVGRPLDAFLSEVSGQTGIASAAAKAHRGVNRGGPKPSVGRGTLQETNVRREPGEPGQMHRYAFELESDGAGDLRFDLEFAIREILDRGAVGPRVRDARITCNRLDQWREAPRCWYPK